MATSMVSLPKDTWTLVSTESVLFQIPDQVSAFAVESATLPTGTAIRKKINPGEIYSFQKLDGNLYLYSPEINTNVAIEPAG